MQSVFEVKEQEILVLFLRHSVQNLRFFFVQRNIDGVNNCTVDSNLTFTPQILYSTRNQERICPLLYNYIIQIRKGTLTDRGFFFLPELTEQKQTTNDWLYACTSSKENDFLHIFSTRELQISSNFSFQYMFFLCIFPKEIIVIGWSALNPGPPSLNLVRTGRK